MRALLVVLVLALAALQYKLWMGNSGVFEWMDLAMKQSVQDDSNTAWEAKNRALEAEIAELKAGDDALEEQARQELGMIKEGELYYQFVDESSKH